MQIRTKFVSSSGRSSVPVSLAAYVQSKPEKSPVRTAATGLDFCGKMMGALPVTGEFWNVTAAEADLGKILVGQHLIGGQTVLIGPIGLVTGTQNSNEAYENHDLSLKSIVCCSAI